MSPNTANANADRPKPTYHHCIKPGHYKNQCRLLTKQREQTENSQNNLGNKNPPMTPIPLNRTATSTIMTTTTETETEPKESQKLLIHPVIHVARQTIPQRNATTEPI